MWLSMGMISIGSIVTVSRPVMWSVVEAEKQPSVCFFLTMLQLMAPRSKHNPDDFKLVL